MKKKKPHVCSTAPSCGCSGWINAPGRVVGRGSGDEHVARVPYCVSNMMVIRQGQSIALIHALEGVLRALEAHVAEEAKRAGVKPGEYCPCHVNEIHAARQAIAWAAEGKEPTS